MTERDQDAYQQTALVPLSPVEIVDEGFDLFKRRFSLFLGIVAVVDLPFALFQIAIYEWLGLRAVLEGEGGAAASTEQQMVGAVVVALGIALFQSLAMIVEGAALTAAVSEVYLGRRITIGEAYRRVAKRLWKLLATWFLIALIASTIAFGTLLTLAIAVAAIATTGQQAGFSSGAEAAIGLSAVGLISIVGLIGIVSIGICASQIVMIEDLWLGQAIVRNWSLVRKRFGRLAGFVLLLFLVVYSLEAAIVYSADALLGATWYSLVTTAEPVKFAVITLIEALASMVSSPFLMVSVTVLYYDLRVRREGFDLSLLERRWAGTPA